MNRAIPTAEWAQELKRFTDRNAGRLTRLEVSREEASGREQELGFPLRGVAYDRRDGRVEIMLGELGSVDVHLTHAVQAARQVDVLSDARGRDEALSIVGSDGRTVLSFVDL